MRLETTLLGRAVRLMSVSGAITKNVHGVVLARACEGKYGFLQGPRTVEEFDIQKGITFLHGKFDNGVIEKFQVFGDGFVAEAKSETDYSDAFLDDIIGWLMSEVDLRTTKEDTSPRFYYSGLEVKAGFSLNEKLAELASVGKFLTTQLKTYRQTPEQDTQLVGIAFAPSAGAEPLFRFERRAGAVEDDRLYYSGAPLRTHDHMVLLERLEDALG